MTTGLASFVGLPPQRILYIVVDGDGSDAHPWKLSPAGIDSTACVTLREETSYYFESEYAEPPEGYADYGDTVLWRPSKLSFNQFPPPVGPRTETIVATVYGFVTLNAHFNGAVYTDDSLYAILSLDGEGQGPLYFALAQAGSYDPSILSEIELA